MNTIKKKAKVLVLDQGISQALWSTDFTSDNNISEKKIIKLMKKYLYLFNIKEWKILHVKSSKKIIFARLKKKKIDYSIHNKIKTIYKDIESEKKVKCIIKRLSKLNLCSFFQIKNEENISNRFAKNLLYKKIN